MIAEGTWMKCFLASVLIHGALLSIPAAMKAPQTIEPIEVFMLQQAGSPTPSGGAEKQDRSQGKSRLGGQGPMMGEQVRIRPPGPSRPAEHKADPLPPAPERMASHEPVARKEPAEPSEPSKPMEAKTEPLSPPAVRVAGIEPLVRKDPAGPPEVLERVATRGGQEASEPINGSARPDGVSTGTGAGGSGTGTGGGSGQGDGTGSKDKGFGSPDGPRFLRREVPEYPFLARRRKKEGSVLLMVVIDAAGKLTKADVVEASDPIFVEASLDAVKKSTFLPARRNGQPVPSKALLPIRFSLTE